jgi:pimeloyl-ACP methyl ester carboxylesterase
LEEAGDAGLGAFLEQWLAGPLFVNLKAEAAGLDARLANTATGLASSLRLAGAGTQEPLWERLVALDMPVFVVAGALDAKFVSAGRRLVEAIGDNARLYLIPGAGHAAHLERPDLFVEALASFVAGIT